MSGRWYTENISSVDAPGLEPGSADGEWEDRDCADFFTQKEAQAFYKASGGPTYDPHYLDADRDGVACEVQP